MTVLPIVERELRVGARNPLFYRSRFMVPLVGAVVLLFTVVPLVTGGSTKQAGQTLMYLCFGGLFMICLISGVTTTADAISREKREGTIGFLFLTDLKGYDIVLGKLVSSSVLGVYALFGILPVVSLIFLLGGVDGWTVVRLVVSCGNALFMSLSAGLLASAWCFEEKRAKGMASGIITAWLAGGPLCGLLYLFATGQLESAGVATWSPFLLSSPVMMFVTSAAPVQFNGLQAFFLAIGLTHLCGWVLLGLACWLAPKRWQDDGQKEAVGRRWWWRLMSRSAAANVRDRTAKLDLNAVHWLTSRDPAVGKLVWAQWGLVVLCFAIMLVYIGRDDLHPWLIVPLVIVLNLAMKVSMAGEACKWLSRDRQDGGLELLLTTPLQVPEILEGQWLSLQKYYLKPFLVGGLIQLLLLAGLAYASADQGNAFGVLLFFLFIMSLVALVDYQALGWVGMWRGLAANPPGKARHQTVRDVLMMPWVIFHVGLIPLGCVLGFFGPLLLWPFTMIVFPLILTNRSKTRLLAEFRTRAMERYSAPPKPGFWKRVQQFLDDMVTPDAPPQK